MSKCFGWRRPDISSYYYQFIKLRVLFAFSKVTNQISALRRLKDFCRVCSQCSSAQCTQFCTDAWADNTDILLWWDLKYFQKTFLKEENTRKLQPILVWTHRWKSTKLKCNNNVSWALLLDSINHLVLSLKPSRAPRVTTASILFVLLLFVSRIIFCLRDKCLKYVL